LPAERNVETLDTKKTYVLQEDSFRKNFKIATCCNPIPGDKVFGFITNNGEVQVHGVNCPVGQKLKASFGNKIITLEWGEYTNYTYLSTIVVRGIDRIGMLNDITKIITTDAVNIKSLEIKSEDGIFEGKISLFVHNVADIQKLCSLMLKIDGMQSVNRLS
jgi:GTP pyrophosphokinase